MLTDKTILATLPAADMARARAFYEGTLGFDAEELPDGGILYDSGPSRFLLYESSFAGTNQATAATWMVGDIATVAGSLRSAGVVFEEYDMGDIKTEDGIATSPDGVKAAWFRDTEGNILNLVELP